MSSAKRQCIDFVELKLDEFEATNKLPADAAHPNVWDFMQCRYPIYSVLLRARLLRWWATVFIVYRAGPDLLTLYYLTPPHRRADFFKFRIHRGLETELEAVIWGCELAIINLLKPDDNLAIFYRYWRAPGTPVLEKQKYDVVLIARRLGLYPYRWGVDNLVAEMEENRKFFNAPEFRRNLFQRLVAAFKEWFCCYLMLALDCNVHVVETLMACIY